MLVLSRKEQEVIVIGENIRITVVRASNGCARIGIDCPKEIPVHRLEIFERLEEQKRQ